MARWPRIRSARFTALLLPVLLWGVVGLSLFPCPLVGTCAADDSTHLTAAGSDSPRGTSSAAAQPEGAATGAQPAIPRRPLVPDAGSALGIDFEDPLEVLVPRQQPSQAERDQSEAATLFAIARQREQRGELVEALRLYERALRLDPTALPILEQVVALAFQLERNDEAVRYALKAAQLSPGEPLLLRQLGLHLSAQGDADGAVRLYEQALEMPQLDRQSLGFPLLLTELAQLYMQAERYEEAAEVFATVQSRLGDEFESPPEQRLQKLLMQGLGGEAEAYEQFAEAYLLAGRFDDARQALDVAKERGLAPARHAYQAARLHAKQDQPTEALSQLDIFFEQEDSPYGRAPYELLVTIHQEQGEPAAATERLQQVWDQQPDNAVLGLFLAKRLVETDQADRAVTIYRELLTREPTSTVFGGLLAILRTQQDTAAILELFGEAVGQLGSLDALSMQLNELAEDEALTTALVDLALVQLDAAEAANGELDDEAARLTTFGRRLAAARLALESERFDDAARLFSAALAVTDQSSGELLMDWGVALLGAGRYEQAAEYLARSLDELPPGTAMPALVRYYLAGALELSSKTDEALKQIQQAIDESADYPQIQPMFFSRKAWIAYHAERRSLAEETYRQLLAEYDLTGHSPQTRQVLREARLVLSNLAVLRGDKPQGEEWLEQVLDEFPDDPSALNDLGYLWADQDKHLERALVMIQRAVEADPENAAYRDSLGWAFYRLGRHEEALTELQRALALSSDPDGVILDHLGDAYFQLGKVSEAVDCWTQALEKFSDSTDQAMIDATRQKLSQQGAVTENREVARGADAEQPPPMP